MAETLRLSGSLSIVPAATPLSGDASVTVELNESVSLVKRTLYDYSLTVDGVVEIPFGNLTAAHYVQIRASAKVIVRVTTADGVTQVINADPLVILMLYTTPATAIDIARTLGTTTVNIVLGQRG
jgi:hypothetical protein